MKLIDALKDGVIGWNDLNRYEEVAIKEFEVDGWIIRRETHALDGYKGKAFALELLDSGLNPYESRSFLAWHEVNSKDKMAKVFGV